MINSTTLKRVLASVIRVSLMIGIFLGMFLAVEIQKHEAVHWVIFRRYSIDSEINWVMQRTESGVVFAETVATSYSNLTQEQLRDMRYLHGLNEIYNPIDFGATIFRVSVLFILSTTSVMCAKKQKHK